MKTTNDKTAGAPWWRWPENRWTGRVAWFVILRRLTFWPLLLIGMVITFVAIVLSFGLAEARAFWRQM